MTDLSTTPWAQTSFLRDATPADTPPHPSRPITDALGAADHAREASARRVALDRLASSLAEQARKRGRSPVPKRAT